MSGAFGYEETEDMDGKETYDYLVKDMGMEPDEAVRKEQNNKEKTHQVKKTKNQNIIKTRILSQEQLYLKFKNKKCN